MSYDKTQLRLLVPRTNADGMNYWTLDSVDPLQTIIAANYISNAAKALASPGVGMIVGDKITVRRWSDLTSKIAANLLSETEHYVSNVTATGATLTTAIGGGIVEDALAVTLTAAQSGSTIVFDKTDGAVITLPAPVPGLEFNFVVDVVSASVGQKILTDAATTFIKGAFIQSVIATPTVGTDVADGTTHRSINFNGTTTGGIAGTNVRLVCRTATQWEVVGGMNLKSGSPGTPFATS